jgi:hypothetical protein
MAMGGKGADMGRKQPTNLVGIVMEAKEATREEVLRFIVQIHDGI